LLRHTVGTRGFARVEHNAQRLVIIVLGTAAVKLAHKNEGSRHKIFQISAIPRDKECAAYYSGQQLFGVWPSCPPSTAEYASCILFQVFHKISFRFLSTILLVVHYEFILHSTIYIVAQTSQLLTEIQNRLYSQLVTDYSRKSGNECCTCVFIAIKYW